MPGQARVARVTSGQKQGSIAAHARTVTAIAFSPDDSVMVTASYDRTVKVWDRR